MHHSQTDIDRLDRLLAEQPPENDGMLLSEFDGFCAGLIVCPEMIPPSEWLPLVWGEDAAPSFASLGEYQAALDLIMEHYNRVARSLMPPSAGYHPVLDVDLNSGEMLWELWVEGFEHAMALRPDAWPPIVESDDEEAAASVNLILAMYHISEGATDLKDDAIDELDAQAPDLIATMVENLNTWTKSRGQSLRTPIAANSNHRPKAKVDRNDPCSCGSGRKHKRCCGAH